MKKILMNDFQKEHLFFEPGLSKAINKTLTSSYYILGEEVLKFETSFAEFIGAKYCIGVANGMEALQISLLALDIKKGDEVITVSNSAVATSLAISNVGATPVFVDIDEYFHIDVKKIESKITKKTKAIIPVHLFGQMADMKPILKIAKKYNLKIVEDACQAHGATYQGKKAGSFGTLGAFSFYPTKNLGGYGDGGAIVTNSKKLYEKCKLLRNYGQESRYIHKIKGLNSRLDELQAAILNIKLKKLPSILTKRQKIAKLYKRSLLSISQIKLPDERSDARHTYHLFVIEATSRDKLQKFLQKNNIETIIHYPIPIHKQESYKEFNKISLVETEKKAKLLLSLPTNPFLSENEIKFVSAKIREFYQ